MRDRSKARRTGLLRRFGGSERGATALEFALVAGPFLYVLGCICETGIMLFTEYVLQNAVQEAAREVRTGQVSTTDGSLLVSADEFKTSICDKLTLISDCTSSVTVYVNNASTFASLQTTIGSPLDIGEQSDGSGSAVVYTPGGQLVAATVIATYDWEFMFPLMNLLSNIWDTQARRLYGLAIFRNEPF